MTKLNCWISAMILWLRNRARGYVWLRRSHSFLGLVPHFGNAEPTGWKTLQVVEYIPPKERWTNDNWVVLFRGSYRVWTFRLVSVERFEDRKELPVKTGE